MSNLVRVLRVIEYVGTREWVEDIVSKSVHGVKTLGNGQIRASTIGEFPDILSYNDSAKIKKDLSNE